MDLLAEVLAQCELSGDAPAISTPGQPTLTYAQLREAILRLATGLRAEGLHPGDRVLFSVRPDPSAVVLALGIVAAGGTAAFADPGVSPELFRARMDLSAPTWLMSESLLYAISARRVGRALARRRGLYLPNLAHLVNPDGRPLRHVHAGRWLPGVPRDALSADRLIAGSAPAPLAANDPEQEAVIVFTSGTTAAPKAVVHSRRSLGGMARGLRVGSPTGPGDVVHTEQLMIGIPALTTGAHWSMPTFGLAPRADPIGYAKGLAGATVTFTVPADFNDVLDGVESGSVRIPPSLRRVLLGAAPVLPPLLRRAARVLPGVEVFAVYGMTEILPVAITPAAEKLAYAESGEQGDLQGTPLPGVKVRIAEDGELMVSGDNLCAGILGRPTCPVDAAYPGHAAYPETAAYPEHATGDLVRIEDGRMVLIGRKTDMIIRRWTNIYPGLYEPALSALPGVAAALMIGVPDEIGDERVVLAVVPDRTDRTDGTDRTDRTDGTDLRVLDEPALAARVTAALPGMIAATALPDEVVVVSHVPLAGRALKPDRQALRHLFRGRLLTSPGR